MILEMRIEGKVLVIEAEGSVSVTVRDVEGAESSAREVVSAVGDDLFVKLAGLRKELATSANVPPYVVFTDKTLREMVERLPSDLAEMGSISGIGQTKLEKYGEQFLAAIKGVAA